MFELNFSEEKAQILVKKAIQKATRFWRELDGELKEEKQNTKNFILQYERD